MKKRIFPLLLTLCLLCSLAACGENTLEEELKYFYGDNLLLLLSENTYYFGWVYTADGELRQDAAYLFPLGETNKQVHYQTEGVEMDVAVTESGSGPSVLVTITNLHESLRLHTGDPYILEKQIGGQWYHVNGCSGFDSSSLILKPGSSREYEIELYEYQSSNRIALSPGHYRVIHEDLFLAEPGTSGPYNDADRSRFINLAAEFDVK